MKLFKYSILYLTLLSVIFVHSSCNTVSSYGRGNANSYDWSDWYGYDESCKTFYAENGFLGNFKAHEITNIPKARGFCGTTSYKNFSDIRYYESGPDSGYACMIKCCKRD
ncbi:MAG TPA: hypothetical protein ENL22_03250 [candidate division Zixibacteria bacterium]|nr:hypothetical protein [candidate division Zixibacteria bacterium]